METVKKYFNRISVVDCCMLIDLIELDILPVLNQVFKRVLIPSNIWEDEIDSETKATIQKYLVFDKAVISTTTGYDLYRKLGNQFKPLSDYDRTAIAIAGEANHLCASNDGVVTKACTWFNVEILVYWEY